MRGFFFQKKSQPLPPARYFRRFLDWPRHQPIHIRLRNRDFHAPDPLSFYWSYHEIMEERIYDFPDAGKARRIVDLGANTGLASLFFLERFPCAEITAVEADPSLFDLLEKNTSGWEAPRLRRIHAAVAPQPGTQRFSPAGADAGRLNFGPGDNPGDIFVPGRILDSFLEHPSTSKERKRIACFRPRGWGRHKESSWNITGWPRSPSDSTSSWENWLRRDSGILSKPNSAPNTHSKKWIPTPASIYSSTFSRCASPRVHNPAQRSASFCQSPLRPDILRK